jgi:hypothetical protein
MAGHCVEDGVNKEQMGLIGITAGDETADKLEEQRAS